MNTSKEALFSHFDRSLMEGNAVDVIEAWKEDGRLKELSSDLLQMFYCPQNNPHHYTDVGQHTLDALRYLQKQEEYKQRSREEKRILLYALLLHDVGKPLSKTTKEGIDHFIGHPKESEKLASKFLEIYCFSKMEKEKILRLILLHDIQMHRSIRCVKRMLLRNRIDPQSMKDLLLIKNSDSFAHVNGVKKIEENHIFYAYYLEIVKSHPYKTCQLAIDAKDIQDRIGVLSEVQVEDILKECLNLVFDHPEKNTKEELCTFVSRGKKRFL